MDGLHLTYGFSGLLSLSSIALLVLAERQNHLSRWLVTATFIVLLLNGLALFSSDVAVGSEVSRLKAVGLMCWLPSGILIITEFCRLKIELRLAGRETDTPGRQVGGRLRPSGPCTGCKYYHGRVYNHELLVCGIHPFGPPGEQCPDRIAFDHRSVSSGEY